MLRGKILRIVMTLAGTGVILATSGCGSAYPTTSSPITSADSEAGRKASAADERFARERREQEAKARQRVKSLPAEG